MAEKTLTGALAVIKVKDIDGKSVIIGKMKTVRATENIRRGRVVGIGEVTPSELPVLEWTGNINVSQYSIKLTKSILNSLKRDFSDVKSFVQDLLFNEGVDISILRKIKKEGGTYDLETFATIEKACITSEGLDISEGQISGRDGTFEYMNPMLYSL